MINLRRQWDIYLNVVNIVQSRYDDGPKHDDDGVIALDDACSRHANAD